jgi:ribose 5-phosphate isomerase A
MPERELVMARTTDDPLEALAALALGFVKDDTVVGLEAELDVTVDGADEVDPDLNLIKGYGGALVRERLVAAASRRQIILVTPDKLVETPGDAWTPSG